MRQMRGFSLAALTIAATAMFAAVAPSRATAGASRQHHATHFAAQRAHHAGYRGYRAYGEYGAGPASAYGAIPDGSGFASPSYPGFGYGYGDNSHGCSACTN
jgi:hypothetical protein